MEQKDIQFNKGIHRAPTMEAEMGELSECVNLIPKNGELVNVKPPVADEYNITLETNELLLCIHEVDGETHYITTYENFFWYRKKNSNSTDKTKISQSSMYIKQVVAVGNALALIYDREKMDAAIAAGTLSAYIPMKYLLWKDNVYIVLGTKPELSAQFKLTGNLKTSVSTHNLQFTAEESHIPFTGGGSYDTTIAAFTAEDIASGTYISSNCTYWKIPIANIPGNLQNGKTYAIHSTGTYTLTIFCILSNGNETDHKDISVNDQPYYVFEKTSNISFICMRRQHAADDNASQCPVTINTKDDEETLGDIDANAWGYRMNYGTEAEPDDTNFNNLMGGIKKYIDDYYHKKHYFIFPFFVRYAYKLYDGSFISISTPLLMVPNDGVAPYILNGAYYSGSNYPEYAYQITSFCTKLNLKIQLDENISKWKDIVKSVCIGITSPIYYINLGEEFDRNKYQFGLWTYTAETSGYMRGFIDNKVCYLKDYIEYGGTYISSASDIKRFSIKPPHFSAQRYKKNHESASIFYQIAEFTIDEASKMTSFTELPDAGDYFEELNTAYLETLPTIPDTYNGNNLFYPNGGFAYNNRLNIYDVKEKYVFDNMVATPIQNNNSSNKYWYIIYYSQDGKEMKWKSSKTNYQPFVRWICVNNTNAFKCRLVQETHADGWVTHAILDINLRPHPWLNVAYAYISNNPLWQYSGTISEYDPELNDDVNCVSNSNALYASNASNPFYFPVSGQNKIGTGRIKTVSTSAKALSEGQFGQFPLYAFTTDGIWALSVDNEGKYATSNPINRDVVNDKSNVCQIDDSVVYTCSQGLKMLSGSESVILSKAMEGNNVDETKFFNGIDNESKLKIADTDTLVNMLQDCKIMYDSAGGRKLHIYPNITINDSDSDDVKAAKHLQRTKHYILDIESGEWTTYIGEESVVNAVVPGYPYSIIQATIPEGSTNKEKLMSYTNKEDNSTMRNGVILTRAMEFGNPFVMKMLCDLKLIYAKNGSVTVDNVEQRAKCKVSVFVSNDRVKWTKLNSLRKHSYKWYRFRIQTSMTDLDALTALTCTIDNRRDNKLR